ncbi:MAG: HAMP domain-containing histidine kinase [Dysgonamonadaceae bacterium]|jgi:signal transduction histidine kinase|nr:HAMP domain-containing histidine kinase [Dysgonamonadaceae bacterium]
MMSYMQKLFLCFLIIFTLFAMGILVLEQSQEREHKTAALEDKLNAYVAIIHADLAQNRDYRTALDSLMRLFPQNMRLTLIDVRGQVLYDNVIKDISGLENHALRPEIAAAGEKGSGTNIRKSSSNEKEYLYYAEQFHDYCIRVALPYNIQVRHFLQPDKLFLYYLAALFIMMSLLIRYVSGRFARSIKQLRDFAFRKERQDTNFSKDELGEIGAKIAGDYLLLEENKKEIALEREKLLQHVHSSDEGLCFFSSKRKVEFYNGLFIQYLNMLIDEANTNPDVLFSDALFEKIASFLLQRGKEERYFETKIMRQGKFFAVKVNIFDDNSFEIVLNDISKQEKTRLLKQEITGNITHELRTPVTGIRGCLETIREHQLTPEKEDYFIESAYQQVMLLSERIQDMSLLTKIDEAPHSFQLAFVVINQLLTKLKHDLEIPLQEKHIQMEWNIDEQVRVHGNYNLLYSIFRNLTDNVIRYAGTHLRIQINKYDEDKDFYYFSYSDNGSGVPNEHLNRLFERFYRINEGRSRDSGGSGLGLSIVKNAIAFHKGTIAAKNRAGGGLEFLFKLAK